MCSANHRVITNPTNQVLFLTRKKALNNHFITRLLKINQVKIRSYLIPNPNNSRLWKILK